MDHGAAGTERRRWKAPAFARAGTRAHSGAACARFARAAALVCAIPFAAACATVDRRAEFFEVTRGQYADARASYEAHIAENGAETTLDRNLAGTAALLQGDVDGAHRHFAEAFADLDDLTATTGETIAATVVAERTKRWKGDAYERSMNAWYLGLTYWMKGDEDNAAASFKAGLLRDADSAEGAAQSDFAALWYALGVAQRSAHHTDGGAAALATAQRLVPALDAAKAGQANVLVVMEAGFVARKAAGGPQGSEVVFRPRGYNTRRGAVFVDGAAAGEVVRGTDISQQAVTRGGGKMDAVNEGKAATKTVSTIAGAVILGGADNHNERLLGAALLAAGLLISAEADVRQWDTLPGEIQFLPLRLAPGRHVIRVEPRSDAGTPIDGAAREFDVSVDAGGADGRVALVWTRSAAPPTSETSGTSRQTDRGAMRGTMRVRTGGRP